MNRREFLVGTGAATAVAAGLLPRRSAAGTSPAGVGRPVALVRDPADPVSGGPPVSWALGELAAALRLRGIPAYRCDRLEQARTEDFCVVIAGGAQPIARDAGAKPPEGAEAFAVAAAQLGGRHVLAVTGNDDRGLVFALTDIADAVRLEEPALALSPAAPVRERPANPIRGVMRLFASDIEDKPWYNDREFWKQYFSVLISERFNRFNLALGLGYDSPSGLRDTYFYFPYPFLVSVPGYDVRATHLTDAERDRNLEMLRFMSDEAAARGLHFQLGLWTHAYQWHDSPDANHVITGLTPRTQAAYCRDALAILLGQCPNIAGVTFRIHGESGVPEGSYGLWRTVFDGCVRCGRPVGIDLHAKGIDERMIDTALATGLPVTVSPKFWAEHLGLPYHQAAIRATELPRRGPGAGMFALSEGSRSFTRYGYADLLSADRKYGVLYRIWPGTQRVLLWGDPVFAAGYGRAGGFAGGLGHEIFDPLSFKGRKGSGLAGNRDGYADASLRAPGYDFEKFRYTFRVWGRKLYDPDARPEAWRRMLRGEHGRAAESVEASLASASRILPLVTTAHLPSAANNNYWPEMYVNMSIVDASRPRPYTDTPSPKRFGTVSPLDPQLFSPIADHVSAVLAGTPDARYSPIEVASWLEDLAGAGAKEMAAAAQRITPQDGPTFRRFVIDASAQFAIGRFFAHKIRAAVLYGLYEGTGAGAALDAAVTEYRAARDCWARAGDATASAYVPDLTYGMDFQLRGHWRDRITAIDEDIAAMAAKRYAQPPAAAPARRGSAPIDREIDRLILAALGRTQRPVFTVDHTAPSAPDPGQAVQIVAKVTGETREPTAVLLHYRHAKQAEPWLRAPMTSDAGTCRASIPAEYANSQFPLLYYFEISDDKGRRALYPGLGADLASVPYFVAGAKPSRDSGHKQATTTDALVPPNPKLLATAVRTGFRTAVPGV